MSKNWRKIPFFNFVQRISSNAPRSLFTCIGKPENGSIITFNRRSSRSVQGSRLHVAQGIVSVCLVALLVKERGVCKICSKLVQHSPVQILILDRSRGKKGEKEMLSAP